MRTMMNKKVMLLLSFILWSVTTLLAQGNGVGGINKATQRRPRHFQNGSLLVWCVYLSYRSGYDFTFILLVRPSNLWSLK